MEVAVGGETSKGPTPDAVVGICASAGGLKPLQELFRALPASSGACYVVVQHLSPDFKSLMQQLLEPHTAMPVGRVEDAAELLANHVYLIPPGKLLRLEGDRLRLQEQDQNRKRPAWVMDVFLESLAAARGRHAIAVILSGTGSDGSRGAVAVSEAGGTVLVQDPHTAEFDGMPLSTLQTGCVDMALAPEALAGAIARVTEETTDAEGIEYWPDVQAAATTLDRVKSLLRTITRLQIEHYKPGTLLRRLVRRCQLTGCQTTDDYLALLERVPEERERLLEDLLISVTSFFRDGHPWEVIGRSVLPGLIERAGDRPFRAWIAAGATGQEAYTLAILLHEAFAARGQPAQFKLFATDISTRALEAATAGVYPASISKELSPEYLERYFQRVDGGWQVGRRLRESVIFAEHDLTSDAPFTRMDFVSCRNMLIYLEPELQQAVLRRLHFALNPMGVLFLGQAETTGAMGPGFEVVDSRWKLYRKLADAPLSVRRLGRLASHGMPRANVVGRAPTPRVSEHLLAAGATLQAFLRGRNASCLLVAADGTLLQVFGNTDGVLQVPQGPLEAGITRWVSEPLRLPLTSALGSIRRAERPTVSRAIALPTPAGQVRHVDVRVEALERSPGGAYAAVFLEPSAADPTLVGEEYEPDEAMLSQLRGLEAELEATRETLHGTVAELETSNEENQTTNEELIASNEELQSTNEELHSVNEELYTVNAEYQAKIVELTQLAGDMDNLLASTSVGVIFLDETLCIRTFTPTATTVVNVVGSDAGRPLAHLTHRMPGVDLVRPAQEILEGSEPKEFDARVDDGRWMMVRVRPYLGRSGPGAGVVLTFVDITARVLAEQAAEQQRGLTTQLLDNVEGVLWVLEADGSVAYVSPACDELFGVTTDDLVADSLAWLVAVEREARGAEREAWSDGPPGGREVTYQVRTIGRGNRWVRDQCRAYTDPVTGEPRFIRDTRDVTEQTEARIAVAASELRFRQVFQLSDAGLCLTTANGVILEANDALADLLGVDHDALTGQPVARWLDPESTSVWNTQHAGLRSGARNRVEAEATFKHAEGGDILAEVNSRAVRGEGASIRYVLTSIRDITAATRAAAELSAERNFSHAVLASAAALVVVLDPEERVVRVNRAVERLLGTKQQHLEGRPFDECILDRSSSPSTEFVNNMSATAPRQVEAWWRTHSSRRLVMWSDALIFDEVGQVEYLVRTGVDITATREAEEQLRTSEAHLRAIIDALPHPVYAHDRSGRFVLANDAAAAFYGRAKSRLVGHRIEEIVDDPGVTARIRQRVSEALESRQVVQIPEESVTDAAGQSRVLQTSLVPVASDRPDGQSVLTVSVDITQRKQAETALRTRAFYDPLTGLPNRDLFVERLTHALGRFQRRDGPPCTVLFMDIDSFKDVNDTKGHHVGDELIRTIGRRLHEAMRPGDTVARFGGDEFAVLLEGVGDARAAGVVARRLHEHTGTELLLGDSTYHPSTSIGIAVAEDRNTTADDILRDADLAMYRAKRTTGPDGSAVFDETMRAEAERRMRLSVELRTAASAEEFTVHYQPTVRLEDGHIVGAEALARWRHPSRGMIMPDQFVPVAERQGLIHLVDRAVIAAVVGALKRWEGEGLLTNGFGVSVNVSANHIIADDFASSLLNRLAEASVDPRRLSIELTETSLLSAPSRAGATLLTLRNAGVRVLLDDFGTGFSSLSHLCRLPLDGIKIDRSFTAGMARGASAKVVEATISLGHSLGLMVVAEGVESVDQVQSLVSLGCDQAQGFLMARPMATADFEDLLAEGHRFVLGGTESDA